MTSPEPQGSAPSFSSLGDITGQVLIVQMHIGSGVHGVNEELMRAGASLVLFTEPGTPADMIRTVDEDEMRRHGWVRA